MNWAPAAYRSPAVALAAGVLVGSVAAAWRATSGAGCDWVCTFGPNVTFDDPGVRKVGNLMVPAFFGTGVFQINFFVDTIFATSSRMPTGSITSLYVADRVMELVLGVYAIALSTAFCRPCLHQAAARKHDEMKRTFGFALRIVSFITIPAAVGLVLLRGPITQVLFQHGAVHGRVHRAYGARAALLFAGTCRPLPPSS